MSISHDLAAAEHTVSYSNDIILFVWLRAARSHAAYYYTCPVTCQLGCKDYLILIILSRRHTVIWIPPITVR